MTVLHHVRCDAYGCSTTAPVLGGPESYSDAGLNQRGWIVDRRQQRSSITGQTYEALRHFCSTECLTTWHEAWREIQQRELVRR